MAGNAESGFVLGQGQTPHFVFRPYPIGRLLAAALRLWHIGLMVVILSRNVLIVQMAKMPLPSHIRKIIAIGCRAAVGNEQLLQALKTVNQRL